MKRSLNLFSQILISFSLTLAFTTISFSEPPNLTLLRKEVKQYYETGLYQQELTKNIEEAHDFVISQAVSIHQSHPNSKLALVLDIDETSLSNYEKMAKRDFMGSREAIHKEILAADSPPIEPMLVLYRDALKHGVQVFFVTGRTESERDATQTNLNNAGYTNWSGLYLRPEVYNQPSIKPFKSKMREEITQKGFTIIASIGDQYSDIEGGYAMKGFKLPNPYYYLP